MITSIKQISLGVIGVAALFATVGLTIFGAERTDREVTLPPTVAEQARNNELPFGGRGGSEALYATNLGDDQKLVGYVQNIFVGRVVKEVDSFFVGAFMQVRYSVRVLTNVKGNLKGEIIVNSMGGDHVGLGIGSTYLFVTKYSSQNNWYVIGAPLYDRKVIAADPKLGDAEAIALARYDERVIALENAYPNEILYEGFVRTGLTYNSYASRCLDANGELIDDTVQIANEKKGLPKAQCVTRLTAEAGFIETPAPTAVPTPIITPKPSLPDVEPVRTPPPPPAIPGL